MQAVMKLLSLWMLFGVSHMALSSEPVRARLVKLLGVNVFLVSYSVLALFIFVPLFMSYMAHQHEGPLLWTLPATPWLTGFIYAGVTLAFILVAAGFLTPSPVIRGVPYSGPRGAHLISRHCLFMGLALWALLHLLVNGYATDVVFFGGFALFCVVGAAHQDRRKLAQGDPIFKTFHAAAPFFPFTGRRTLEGLKGFSPLALVAGLGLTILIRVFHADLFS